MQKAHSLCGVWPWNLQNFQIIYDNLQYLKINYRNISKMIVYTFLYKICSEELLSKKGSIFSGILLRSLKALICWGKLWCLKSLYLIIQKRVYTHTTRQKKVAHIFIPHPYSCTSQLHPLDPIVLIIYSYPSKLQVHTRYKKSSNSCSSQLWYPFLKSLKFPFRLLLFNNNGKMNLYPVSGVLQQKWSKVHCQFDEACC